MPCQSNFGTESHSRKPSAVRAEPRFEGFDSNHAVPCKFYKWHFLQSSEHGA